MKEELREIVGRAGDPALAVNFAREYLQARILLALQESGAMIPLAFQGGTALRFLFRLPRFSEDLDFALERPERADFDLTRAADRLQAHLRREGYEPSAKLRTRTTVQSVMVTFTGLLHDLRLSPHRSQRIAIRIEVDTPPRRGRDSRPRSSAGTRCSTSSIMISPRSWLANSTRFWRETGPRAAICSICSGT